MTVALASQAFRGRKAYVKALFAHACRQLSLSWHVYNAPRLIPAYIKTKGVHADYLKQAKVEDSS